MAIKVSFGSIVVEADYCLRIERPKIAGLHLSCHCGVRLQVKFFDWWAVARGVCFDFYQTIT